MKLSNPIGIFDSGMGGLSILKEIKSTLPQYDYLYLGDNARVPYGNRSFETVYQYTWQCVKHLLEQGCPLVIIACNTASAKALRTIQQVDLPREFPNRKVLGVIRPTTEIIGDLTKSNHIGICATEGTVASQSYEIEINKFFPDVTVFQQACPMWVPLIENDEHHDLGANYFVNKYTKSLLDKSDSMDTIILGCTHYPLLLDKIRRAVSEDVTIIAQGEIVTSSLKDYLIRHEKIEKIISKEEKRMYLTTDDPSIFNKKALIFLEEEVSAIKVTV